MKLENLLEINLYLYLFIFIEYKHPIQKCMNVFVYDLLISF